MLGIKALKLTCSPVQVEVELLPVVFDGITNKDNMGLGQDGCGTERTKFLSLVEDTSEAWTLVTKASIRKAELCNG